MLIGHRVGSPMGVAKEWSGMSGVEHNKKNRTKRSYNGWDLKKNTNIYLVYINLANSKTNLAQARLTYRVLCFSLSIKGKTLATF